MRTLFLLLVLLVVTVYFYPRVIRPWHLRWGATTAEAAAKRPGDEIIPDPRINATHAITIQAPASEVWPWIIQIGQGRGGFYSYTWMENLVGCDIENADRILPRFQELKVGDGIRLHPKAPAIPVTAVQPDTMLLMGGPPAAPDARIYPAATGDYRASWAFYVQDTAPDRCRLIVRFRADWKQSWPAQIAYQGLLEPVHFVMEQKMLRGIRNRAEALHLQHRNRVVYL
jgi:hypothetical protein